MFICFIDYQFPYNYILLLAFEFSFLWWKRFSNEHFFLPRKIHAGYFWVLAVLVRVSFAVMEHHGQKQPGKDLIWFTLPHPCSSLKEVGKELTRGRTLEA